MGNTTSLYKAAGSLDLSDLRVQVQKHPSDIDVQEPEHGWTPLHVAAHKGFEAGVRELLARGSKPDQQDKEGRTALHLAAEIGCAQVVHDLLRRGASRTVRDKAGRLPYDCAVQRHPTVAALLACASAHPPPPSSVPPLGTVPSLKSVSSSTTMPPVDLLSGSSARELLPPPPPSGPLQRTSPIPASTFPRTQHEQMPLQPLLPHPSAHPQQPHLQPQQPRPAPLYPTTPAAGYDPRAWAPTDSQRHALQAAAPAGVPLPYPQAPGVEQQPQPQPWAPLPYPSLYPPAPAQPAPQPRPPPPPPPPVLQGFSSEPQPQGEPSAPPAPRPASETSLKGRDGAVGPAGGRASGGAPAQASAAAADDWAPAPRGDWGDELDSPPGAQLQPQQSQSQPRPNFNPIQSARIQFEKLLGAGLSQLAVLAGHVGGGSPGGGAQRPGAGGGRSAGADSASAGGARAAAAAAGDPAGREPSGVTALSAESSVMSGISVMSAQSRVYSYERLQEATGNFSALQKLGEGGYGPVYRGFLDGIPVAVKVMDTSEGCMQGRLEFEAEVNILTSLHHPHVVLLIGSCPEKGILVYELMPNGSLETHLFGRGASGGGGGAGSGGGSAAAAAAGSGPRPLPWQHRVRIAAEVASALLFLHTAPTPIVHMDLKPANILLDTHLTAKLGDVGLARLAPTLARPAGPAAAAVHGGGISTVLDSRLVGTFEYMDPEYMQTAQYSPRSDVYALGMVMLNMLTGKEGKQVISVVDSERRDPLRFGPCIDPRAGGWPLAEAAAFADLALRCVSYSRQDRPDLRTVILPTLSQLKQRTMLYDQAPAGPHPQAPLPQPDSVPPMFLCPITQDVMEEPVVAADGYTYERLAITEWIARSATSPLTNLPLSHTTLVENRVLRSAIADWREQQAQQGAQQQQHQQQQQQARRQQQQQQQQPAVWQAPSAPAAAAAPPPPAGVAAPAAPAPVRRVVDTGGW